LPNEIPLDEVKKLAEKSMEENALILQALAEYDKRTYTKGKDGQEPSMQKMNS
jgi:hypothetical protein